VEGVPTPFPEEDAASAVLWGPLVSLLALLAFLVFQQRIECGYQLKITVAIRSWSLAEHHHKLLSEPEMPARL
jgi:hypothetical protein